MGSVVLLAVWQTHCRQGLVMPALVGVDAAVQYSALATAVLHVAEDGGVLLHSSSALHPSQPALLTCA